MAAKAPNTHCVLVVVTQFVSRIHSKMNGKLTKEHRIFLLLSLWKKSDKPEVVNVVVGNKFRECNHQSDKLSLNSKQEMKELKCCRFTYNKEAGRNLLSEKENLLITFEKSEQVFNGGIKR